MNHNYTDDPFSSLYDNPRYGKRYIKRPFVKKVPDSLKFATATPPGETPCADCGWPLSCVTGSVLTANDGKSGSRKYRHNQCPSLKRRAELREQAQMNA